MKLGLIVRADNSGLGNQTWEIYRHLNPDHTLVIDLSMLADVNDHCNKHVYLDRFPDALVHGGLTPTPDVIEPFLAEMDVIFSAETFYTFDLLHRANHRNIKSVLQYNYEFLAHLNNRTLPRPTLFAAPSLWHYFVTNLNNKIHLPVPIATDRFTPNPAPPETARTFLHPVGKPAIFDRNGTEDLIAALPWVRSTVTIVFRCQRPGYVENLLRKVTIPRHVTVEVDTSSPENYWDNYQGVDAVILPRRYGGLCLPANESLGAGLPILMPAIDPNNRWLPAEWLMPTLTLSSFNTINPITIYRILPETLALKIDAFATDVSLYTRAVAEARRLAHLYSWKCLLPQYHSVLQKLAEKM